MSMVEAQSKFIPSSSRNLRHSSVSTITDQNMEDLEFLIRGKAGRNT